MPSYFRYALATIIFLTAMVAAGVYSITEDRSYVVAVVLGAVIGVALHLITNWLWSRIGN